MRRIAIIPARGGSKRIPRKNLRSFCGKPIISYSIVAAIQSGLFDDVVVSTDDQEIAETAILYGASVPFFRSPENSNDFAGTAAVLIEVLQNLQGVNRDYERFCCIYPTAPFVTTQILQSADKELDRGISLVMPIVQYSFPIQRSFYLKEGNVRYVYPEFEMTRSQDLEPRYHDAGQFYMGDVKSFMQRQKILSEDVVGIVISELVCQDIDTESDWKIAELKYKIQGE